jgi:hypothetical protein
MAVDTQISLPAVIQGISFETREDGSVVLTHLLTGSYVLFTSDGDVSLQAARTNIIGRDKVGSVVLGMDPNKVKAALEDLGLE